MKSVSLSTLSPLRSLVSMNHHCRFKSGVSILYNPLTLPESKLCWLQSQTFLRSSFCHKAPDLGLSSGFLLLTESLCDCNNNLSVSCHSGHQLWFLLLLWFLLYIFSCRRSFLLAFQPFSSIVVTDEIINTVILVCPWKELSSESSYTTILSNPLIMTFQ